MPVRIFRCIKCNYREERLVRGFTTNPSDLDVFCPKCRSLMTWDWEAEIKSQILPKNGRGQ